MSMNITRRHFLVGTISFAVVAAPARAWAVSYPDVVVVGAGAAGLAATRVLTDLGYRVVLIEARSRVGGRAFTETTTFGVPYDHGCRWLHVAHLNPWVPYAKAHGFHVYAAPDAGALYIAGHRASAAEEAHAWRRFGEFKSAIAKAGRAGRDVSPAEVLEINGGWDRMAANFIGPWEFGKDLKHLSCVDWVNGVTGNDWFCREGFGTLVAHYARGIPVRLATPVRRVGWGGRGVSVETPAGTLPARAIIITVSTGALAGGVIRFDPPLDPKKEESFHKISMGNYNHIALQFSKDPFGLPPDSLVAYQTATTRSMGLLTNISGSGLNFAYVGGSFARDLEKAGVAAAVDFGLGELRRIFGSTIDRTFVKGNYTRWGEDPWTLGSFASAEPGHAHLRKTLRAPIADRIFFAGEACHPSLWATCGGARLSGEQTARDVAAALGLPG